MNRIIQAIIEEVKEQVTADKLTTILVELTTDIITGKVPEDAVVSMSMTAEEFNEVGAVWRHQELWDTFYQEICAKFVQFKFGDLMAAAAESADDIMDIAKSSKAVVEEAGYMTKMVLTVRYHDRPFNEKLAQELVDKHNSTLGELLTLVRNVIADVKEEIEAADQQGAAPSATLYQFPSPPTVQ